MNLLQRAWRLYFLTCEQPDVDISFCQNEEERHHAKHSTYANHCVFKALLIVFAILIAPRAVAQKPLLSDEVGRVMDFEGIDAAKVRFSELYPAAKEQFEFDMNGMFELGSQYMQSGDSEEGAAVMEMNAQLVQATSNSYMQGAGMHGNPGVQEALRQEEQRAREEEESLKQSRAGAASGTSGPGEARDDLERFAGIYGDPKTRDEQRALWVLPSCNGYLVSGATWVDTSPWWLRSTGPSSFAYRDGFQQLNLEFETDSGGNVNRINHDLEYLPSPLVKLGPPRMNGAPVSNCPSAS